MVLFVPFENWVPFDENEGLASRISIQGLKGVFSTQNEYMIARVEAKDS